MKTTYPMPLILDGEVNKKTLNYLKKDKYWLENELAKKILELEDVFYAFYRKKKIFLIRKSEL